MTGQDGDAAGGVRLVELDLEVTAAAGLGEPARIRATAALPRPADLPAHPIVVFALPGAGFSRGYYSFDMPGSAGGGQAGWHARRGWIVVALDPLGVGESSLPDPMRLLFRPLAAANHAAAQEVLRRLAAGALADGFPAIAAPVVLGLGQSLGGCLTVVQQAHHDTFDAIAVLGFSAVHTRSTVPPGAAPTPLPSLTRDTLLGGAFPPSFETRHASGANRALLGLTGDPARYPNQAPVPPGWSYHFDDEPPEVVARDMGWMQDCPPWRSATMPAAAFWTTAPGAIAAEAASIVTPVLSAFGERDVVEDPRMEARAYRHAVDFSLFICPRMAHMHNFAGTREILWSRIDSWGRHVAELKARLPGDWPAQLFSDSY